MKNLQELNEINGRGYSLPRSSEFAIRKPYRRIYNPVLNGWR
jgi:hypothetical protein